LYRHAKKGGKEGKVPSKPFRYNPNDKAIRLQEEANRRAEERRKAKAEGKIPYTTQELFRK